jgi:hypothetical protein
MTKHEIIRDLRGERQNLVRDLAVETGADEWSAIARREMKARIEEIDSEIRERTL